MVKQREYIGFEFGRFTVLSESERNKFNQRMFLCKCSCGNQEERSISQISKTIRLNSDSCCYECLAEIKKNNMRNITLIEKDRERNRKHAIDMTKKRLKKVNKDGTTLDNLTEKKSKNNTSGHKGVSWNFKRKRWESYIHFKRKKINLGRYIDKQDAIKARAEAEEKYFKPILEKYEKENKS